MNHIETLQRYSHNIFGQGNQAILNDVPWKNDDKLEQNLQVCANGSAFASPTNPSMDVGNKTKEK
mgnify:CR=1 FL=1